MAEGARLESVYTLIAYRGFESLSLRQFDYARAGSLLSLQRGCGRAILSLAVEIHALGFLTSLWWGRGDKEIDISQCSR